jgi:hypothetical protein
LVKTRRAGPPKRLVPSRAWAGRQSNLSRSNPSARRYLLDLSLPRFSCPRLDLAKHPTAQLFFFWLSSLLLCLFRLFPCEAHHSFSRHLDFSRHPSAPLRTQPGTEELGWPLSGVFLSLEPLQTPRRYLGRPEQEAAAPSPCLSAAQGDQTCILGIRHGQIWDSPAPEYHRGFPVPQPTPPTSPTSSISRPFLASSVVLFWALVASHIDA